LFLPGHLDTSGKFCVLDAIVYAAELFEHMSAADIRPKKRCKKMIRVIIEREIAEGLEEFYESEIANLLGAMAGARGYLSGESLVDIQRPNHYVVVTRWTDEAAWNRWYISGERQRLLDAIRPFLLGDEKFTLLKQLIFQQGVSAA
jgi:heme-degrading monooxygenase HmoA